MQRRNAKNIMSPDLNQTKVTPRTRPVHEAGHDYSLINTDPLRKYILVPSNEEHPLNYQYYLNMGYEVEECKPGGVRIRMGSPVKEGKPLKARELVLVSCDLKTAQKIFEEGHNGLTGQRYYDNMMARIKRNPTERKPHEIIDGLTEKYDISDNSPDVENNTFR